MADSSALLPTHSRKARTISSMALVTLVPSIVRASQKHYGRLEWLRLGIERKVLEVVVEEERWEADLTQPLDPPYGVNSHLLSELARQ